MTDWIGDEEVTWEHTPPTAARAALAPQDSEDAQAVQDYVKGRLAPGAEFVEIVCLGFPFQEAGPSPEERTALQGAIAACPLSALVCVLGLREPGSDAVGISGPQSAALLETLLSTVHVLAPAARWGLLSVGANTSGERAMQAFEANAKRRGELLSIQYLRKDIGGTALAGLRKLHAGGLTVFPPVLCHGLRAHPEGKPECTVLCFGTHFLERTLTIPERDALHAAFSRVMFSALRRGFVIVVDNVPALTGERPKAAWPWWSAAWTTHPGVELRHASYLDRRVTQLARELGNLRPSKAVEPLRVALITDRARPGEQRTSRRPGQLLNARQYLIASGTEDDFGLQVGWLDRVEDIVWGGTDTSPAESIRSL